MECLKNIADLPDEVLLEIFSYFTIEELALSIQHVNSHWRELSQDDSLWKDVIFKPDETMSTEEIINYLIRMPALHSFKSTKNTDMKMVIDAMTKFCRDIQHIEFNLANKLDIPIMTGIQDLINIKSLSIPVHDWSYNSHVEIAKLLGQCHSLTNLCFTGMVTSPWIPGLLQQIADGCKSLQHIKLEYVCFTEEDMVYFLEKKKDQLLSFIVNSLESAIPYRALANCSKLQTIHFFDMVDVYPSHNDFNFLSNLLDLKNLSLHKCSTSDLHHIRDSFVSGSLSQITTLELGLNFFLDANILAPILRNGSNIQILILSHNRNLRDEGFSDIGNCYQLRRLSINGCGSLTDKTVEYVSTKCFKLEYLDISYCYLMSDNVMKHIVKCQNLRVLKMESTLLRGSHFNLISYHLSHLLELNVRHCEKLNTCVLDELHNRLPVLKIIQDYYR